MMEVERFENPNFTSNTYLVRKASQKDAFLIDIGEYDLASNAIKDYNIRGLLLTHAHYDHIYYVRKLKEDFPNLWVYGSEDTLTNLKDPKLNLSFYHDDPVSFDASDFSKALVSTSGIFVIAGLEIHWFDSPGHHKGCISYRIGSYLFSGDSFIPGFPIVTKLRGGSKEDARLSLSLIKEEFQKCEYLAPGHGPIYQSGKFSFPN
jgi:glyoxylase-like metal-dependent hydrolase (beta-lactamase superfamily II)